MRSSCWSACSASRCSSRSSPVRFRVPYTVALVVAGALVGIGASAGRLSGVAVSPRSSSLVLLPGLVFEAAYRLSVASSGAGSGAGPPGRPRRPDLGGGRRVLLNVGTGLRLDLAFIVGAMVSATDPAAVVATFKRLGCPTALSTMVDGEACSTMGPAWSCSRSRSARSASPSAPARPSSPSSGSWRQPGHRARDGVVATRAIGLVDDHLVELTITVVLAYGSYIVADQLGLSGVIATVTAAIVLGNSAPAGRCRTGSDAIDTVWEFFAYLLTAVVFLLVGLAIPPLGCSTRSCRSAGDRRGLIGRAAGRLRPAPRAPGRRPDRGWPRCASRLAPRPVLGRFRGAEGARGTLVARHVLQRHTVPGDHLWGRPVHPPGPGDDDRPGRRSLDPSRSHDRRLPTGPSQIPTGPIP